MRVVQNGSTSMVTISTSLSDVSNTADMEPSPPDHLSGNPSVLMSHPRINSSSEPNTLYYVRSPPALYLLCHIFVLLLLSCIYCFFPPLSADRRRDRYRCFPL